MADKKIRITIDKEKCKGCALCVPVCPNGVLDIVKGSTNKKGMRYIEVKHPEKCTGCGLCLMMCPDCGINITIEEDK